MGMASLNLEQPIEDIEAQEEVRPPIQEEKNWVPLQEDYQEEEEEEICVTSFPTMGR